MAQITIERTFSPSIFGSEVGWQIVNQATNDVVDCEATGFPAPSSAPVQLSVPAGDYEVRAFDSFGDGWDNGQITVTQGGVVLCQSGYSGGGSNTCPGPTAGTVICSFQVAAPCNVICPGDIVVDNDPGQCGAVVNFTVDDTSCGTPATVDPPSGSEFLPGTTTVTATSGTSSCSFNVTVNDTEPPVVTCPDDIVITLAPGECEEVVNYTVDLFENCAGFGSAGTVSAPPFNSNGQRGIQFDIRNDGGLPMTITGFQARVSLGQHPMEVWYTNGPTAIGVSTNQAAWTLLGSAMVTGQNWTATSPVVDVPIGGLVLAPGESKGIYLTVTDFGIVGYSNGNVTSSDGTLTIISNGHSGGTYPFGSQFTPRRFHGSVSYDAFIPVPELVQTSGLPSGSSFHHIPGFYENCFEATDNQGLTGSCCFTVTVEEYPNPTQALTCNDKVQVSLDEDCSSVVGADMILEGGPYGCYDTRYTVMVLSPTGQNLGNIVTSSYIGSEWTVKVVDNETGQSCWGSIIVEDKLKPTIECRDVTIDCNGELPDVPAPQITGPQIQLQQPFDIIENGPGTSPRVYDFDYSYLPAGTPVLDVDVRVKLTGHTWLPDLNIEAIDPSGQAISVFGVTGCFGQEWPIDVWFDDEGTGGLTQCAQLDAGGAHIQCLVLPGVQNPTVLSGFDGNDASGTWSIRVTDSFAGDDGVIEEVGLAVTVDLPQVDPADNCGPVTVDFVDSFNEGDCGGPSGTVVRTWTVTDASGNSASCNQTITYDRPTLDDVLVPLDIKWTCDQYNAYPNITEATHLHPYITDTDAGTVIIDVNLDPNCDDDDQTLTNANGDIIASKDWPSINSTNVANGGNGCPGDIYSFFPATNSGLDDADVLELTGSGVPTIGGEPLEDICGISYEWEDLHVEVCPGTFKIIRKWTLIDWCANPVDVREVNQVIKVVDEEGPSINAPDDLTIDVYSASVPSGNPHAVCEGTFVVPAASGISDNCSGVESYTTELWDGGSLLQTLSSNGGVFSGVPMFQNGLPAQYTVVYYATDGCGNQGSDATQITLRDKVPPVAVCDEITEVSITNNGLNTGESCSTLFAADLDDGSYDNCKPVYFLMAKMDDSFSPNIYNRCYYPSRDFCCEDLGEQTVILLVLDGDPSGFFTTLNSPSLGCDGTPGLFLTSGFTALNYNTCMVTVQVTDKLSPILVNCPANQRVTCDWYADNLETQLNGLSSSEQCDVLSQYFGSAEFWDNCSVNVTCNTNVNIDQCLEGSITRTWSAQDDAGNNGLQSCTQTIFVDHVSDWVVEFPADITVTCGNDVPDFGEPEIFYETCELVAVSFDDQVFTTVPDACYKIQRTWTVINWCVVGDNIDEEVVESPENGLGLPFPACDLDGDGDCDNRTFRDSWNATSKPTAANATQTTDPDTDLDSDPWDGYIVYKQVIKVIDDVDPVFPNGCDIDDVCILDNSCSATVLLPTPEVQECSANVTISASGDLGNGFGPFTGVAPGTYEVTYKAIDNCNNQTVCHTSVTVKDCKKPTPYCKNGLVIELMNTDPAMVQIWASDFDAGSFDNCPGSLELSFSADVNDKGRTYTCDELGQQPIQLWVTDAAGNQDYCETFVIIQANMGQCDDDPLVAGVTATESDQGVEGVNVGINNANGSYANNTMTDVSGAYQFNGVPAGGDYTVTPMLDENPLNGVSTFDLVLISKHILGVEMLNSPYKIIAADANKSGSVTTFDLVEIRKLILFITTEFPNNTSWRFVPKDYVFADPMNPFEPVFPEVININNLSVDELNADFVAIKVGDVNGNAVTSLAAGAEDRTVVGDLVLNAENARLSAGEEYTVTFRSTEFNVSGYQFTLNFDASKLEFVSVESGLADASNFGLTMASEGVITASWNSDAVKYLPEGEVVFGLRFKANSDVELKEALSINSRYTASEAYNANNELLNVALSFEGELVSDGFALYQNSPNPFAGETVIGFYLPEATSATLTISDVQGKVVKVLEGEYAKGYNTVVLKRGELNASGVMYYRLETATDSATRKMVVVE